MSVQNADERSIPVWFEKTIRGSYARLRSSRYQAVAKALLIVVPFGFMLVSLYNQWSELSELDISIDPAQLSLATIALTLVFTLLPLSMQLVMATLGCGLTYISAYCSYFLSQLAKYLPGGIWIVPGRVVALKAYGVSALASSIGAVLELLLLLLAGLLVSVLLILTVAPTVPGALLCLVFIALTILFVVLANDAVRFLPKKWKDSLDIELRSRQLVKTIGINVLFWAAVGLAFYVLIGAIYQLPLAFIPATAGAFSAAWVAGFIAFLTPGGLGVREGALAFLLSGILPPPLPIIISLVARVWWTTAELLSVFLAAIINRLISRITPR